MPVPSKTSLRRAAFAAYACICAALGLLLVLSAWYTYNDVQSVGNSFFRSLVARVAADAQKNVGRLESDLRRQGRDAGAWQEIRTAWLADAWRQSLAAERGWLYLAVVSSGGDVLLHSDPQRQEEQLTRGWYDTVVFDDVLQVVQTSDATLAGGREALDMRVPIRMDEQVVGTYHTGVDRAWFERQVAGRRRELLWRRAGLIGAVFVVVVAGATSLYFIATHSVFLRQAVKSAHVERSVEISRLAAGLAHEIRNPLHAIRLNLHTFRRAQEAQIRLPAEELETLIEESILEIDRIDGLMHELIGFATPEKPARDAIDLKSELQSVVDFISQEMMDNNVQVALHVPSRPVTARIDSGRLRQILLNLLHNASEAGREERSERKVDVGLQSAGGRAVITVADDGPGIPEADRRRVFEPFFTRREQGTGLGLALVKRFVEEADGSVTCEENDAGGSTFRISLPEAPKGS